MKIIKRTDGYIVIEKRNGRYGVRNKHRKWVGGEEKLKVLTELGLVEAPKKAAPSDSDNAESETSSEEESETQSSTSAEAP
jgi:hypothetical protein